MCTFHETVANTSSVLTRYVTSAPHCPFLHSFSHSEEYMLLELEHFVIHGDFANTVDQKHFRSSNDKFSSTNCKGVHIKLYSQTIISLNKTLVSQDVLAIRWGFDRIFVCPETKCFYDDLFTKDFHHIPLVWSYFYNNKLSHLDSLTRFHLTSHNQSESSCWLQGILLVHYG